MAGMLLQTAARLRHLSTLTSSLEIPRAASLVSCRHNSSRQPDGLPNGSASGQSPRQSHVETRRRSSGSAGDDDSAIKSQSQATMRQLAAPLLAYNRAQNARPYLTQILSSLTIYFCGDLLSQYIEHEQRVTTDLDDGFNNESARPFWITSYDPFRSLRALVIGGTFSLPSYRWFLFLSHTSILPTQPVQSLISKILINQLLFTAIFQVYFFSMHAIMSGASPVERVKECMPTAWTNSWKFWPLANAINFTLIQPRSRSVFVGVIAAGWQAYLGLVNGRAGRRTKTTPAATEGV